MTNGLDDILPPDDWDKGAPDPIPDGKQMCGRCYDIVDEVFPANCAEKPEDLDGQPIGMYHCPDCGAMILAGLPHLPLCQVCIDRRHPGFDGGSPRG